MAAAIIAFDFLIFGIGEQLATTLSRQLIAPGISLWASIADTTLFPTGPPAVITRVQPVHGLQLGSILNGGGIGDRQDHDGKC